MKAEQTSSRPFHLMAKPVGPLCNLNCTYCFYLSKTRLYPDRRDFRMSEEVLEQFVKSYMQQPVRQINFTWQGGEPTLMGIDFFRKALELQEKHRPPNKEISNSIQTNGSRLDDEWGRFLKKHDFLVGLSLDGPERFHDYYRQTKGGQGSFDSVMRGLEILKKHEVEYNILCCLNRRNADHPFELYEFFRKHAGTPYWQFIPIVERSPHHSDQVTDYSIRPDQYGFFLKNVFNRWVRNDLGEISIRIFDVVSRRTVGISPGLCVFAETCGDAMAIEHNGDIYSCDHFVDADHFLGNVTEEPLQSVANRPKQKEFGEAKRTALPEYCRNCDVQFICRGGCPKDRFVKTPEGEKGLNYLCEGYKSFFTYSLPYFKFIMSQMDRGISLPQIRQYIRQNQPQFLQKEPARNELCYCGSGRKYKKCCGG